MMRRLRAALMLAGLTAAAGGCLPDKSQVIASYTVYQCGQIQPVFSVAADGTAKLRVDALTFTMVQVPAASGARYQDSQRDDTVFWEKDGAVTITLHGEELSDCQPLADK